MTLLPLEIARFLGVAVDDTERIAIDGAGGGSFVAYPSIDRIDYAIERDGYRPIRWKGIAYFTEGEQVVLLGHQDWLEKFA